MYLNKPGYRFFLITFLLTTFSCNESKGQEREAFADTIPEMNDPQNLDLSKHQLFLDTSRNSQFFRSYENEHRQFFDSQAVAYFVQEIYAQHRPKSVSLDGFPDLYIELSVFKGEYVIYDPCDGSTPSVRISDSILIHYNQLEPDADLIRGINFRNDSAIEIGLWTIQEKTEDQSASLLIEKTKIPFVYALSYSYGGYTDRKLYTDTKGVKQFNMLVNHCTDRKMIEYSGVKSAR